MLPTIHVITCPGSLCCHHQLLDRLCTSIYVFLLLATCVCCVSPHNKAPDSVAASKPVETSATETRKSPEVAISPKACIGLSQSPKYPLPLPLVFYNRIGKAGSSNMLYLLRRLNADCGFDLHNNLSYYQSTDFDLEQVTWCFEEAALRSRAAIYVNHQ